MKIGIAVRLQVICGTDTSIGLNRCAAARFISSTPIAGGAIAINTVERMVAAKLMPHFMRYEVNVKVVTNWSWQACNALRLDAIDPNAAKRSNTATASRKHMSKVVI